MYSALKEKGGGGKLQELKDGDSSRPGLNSDKIMNGCVSIKPENAQIWEIVDKKTGLIETGKLYF